eukprot:TRINITY_DN8035_c0_g1_i1.p2 TRINITY_DN8035_c0_g1~~TRINITY_DN8035_c0_g1_i1.p2  ORF type:complete len:161 (+),score=11.53 TRINITY_DN8035_c0_g1_i1:684-1166(+)
MIMSLELVYLIVDGIDVMWPLWSCWGIVYDLLTVFPLVFFSWWWRPSRFNARCSISEEMIRADAERTVRQRASAEAVAQIVADFRNQVADENSSVDSSEPSNSSSSFDLGDATSTQSRSVSHELSIVDMLGEHGNSIMLDSLEHSSSSSSLSTDITETLL